MKCDEAIKYADILENGSILAGKSVVCDGYSDDRATAIFTYIHSDHVSFFETALNKCDDILVTKPIYDMLVTLKGEPLKFRNYFRILDFNSSFPNKFGDRVTFYPSNNALGSAQVMIESDGVKILYSGEFNFQDREAINCDILVLDSIHGDPQFDYHSESVSNKLIELVREEIDRGKPVLIKADNGRLQEIMSLLDKELIGAVKYLADEKDIKLMEVYNQNGMSCNRNIVPTNSNPIANRIINSGIKGDLPFVHFCQVGARDEGEDSGIRVIKLSSDSKLFGNYDIKEIGNNRYVLDLLDDTTSENILSFVEATGAKCVVTDNAQNRDGKTIANIIKEGLKIPACTRPV